MDGVSGDSIPIGVGFGQTEREGTAAASDVSIEAQMSEGAVSFAVLNLGKAMNFEGMHQQDLCEYIGSVLARDNHAKSNSGLPLMLANEVIYYLVDNPDAGSGITFTNGEFRVEETSRGSMVAVGIRLRAELFVLGNEDRGDEKQ